MVSLQKFSHMTQVSSQHTSLDLQQGFQLGAQQGMPKTLTFSDRFGHELPDADNAIDDDHDSTYAPSDRSSSSSDDDDFSVDASSHSSSSSSSHSDGDDDNNVAPPLAAPGGPAGVINAAADEASEATDEASEATTDEEDDTTETSATQAIAASQPGCKSEPNETINDTDHLNPTLAIPDVTVSRPTDSPEPGGNTGVGTTPVPESTGVGTEPGYGGNTGVGTAPVPESTRVGTTRKQQLHKMQL